MKFDPASVNFELLTELSCLLWFFEAIKGNFLLLESTSLFYLTSSFRLFPSLSSTGRSPQYYCNFGTPFSSVMSPKPSFKF
jgi:hypothetical protein